jgi:tetratricopeptide (TPR) repeat protein
MPSRTLAFCMILAATAALAYSRASIAFAAEDKAQEIQQLVEKGDLAAARAQLTQVLKNSPEDPGLLNLMGIVDAQQGNYRAAEASFQKAIAAAPKFVGAYLNLGRLYQENAGKDPEALKKGQANYERLLKIDPANLEANYQVAFLECRRQSFESSLRRLSRLPDNARGRPQALAVQCADDAGLKKQAEAESAADQLLKHPDLAEADVLQIVPILETLRDDTLLEKLLEGLETRQMASATSLHQLALLYQQHGKLAPARATLEKVAQLQQSVSVPLLLELARVADQQGDHEGTLGYLAHARDLDPNNAPVHFFFGMVCVEMNLAEEAYRSLQKAVRLDPGNPYYNYALGAVMMNRDVVRDAYPYFRKYCSLKPGDPRGHLALGAAYFYGHDTQRAREELQRVVKYPATSAGAHYFLGRIANQEGHYAEAQEELVKALAANPGYAEAYAELGLLHLKQKEYAQAEQELRKALEVSPDSYTANLNLMILYQRTSDSRAGAQVRRFEEIKKLRAEKQKEFLRTIEVRP